jgi:2-polyprenyl-3-methyl-5-hydroxy-6-metoxy-1,4-benzoquinol methylase
MRSGSVPESLLEMVALAGGFIPEPLVDTLLAAGLCRTLMVATRVGLFDALAGGPLELADIAHRCGTDPAATGKLLSALEGARYVRAAGDRWALTTMARRWLPRAASSSLHDHVELMFVVWRWFEHYERYVRTGEPLDVHRDLSPEEWGLYQRGMRSLAALVAPEMALRTPVPRGARDLLDIGGSHGLLSAALCRRHASLSATILDLPEALAHAAPLADREGLGHRIRHREGDARTADLGHAAWDVIFVANLVHHFDPAENLALFRRAAAALRPGGVLVIQEVMRGGRGDQAAALGDLYFGALSASGIFGSDEIASWQKQAGLVPRRPIRFVTYPAVGQQAARKK